MWGHQHWETKKGRSGASPLPAWFLSHLVATGLCGSLQLALPLGSGGHSPCILSGLVIVTAPRCCQPRASPFIKLTFRKQCDGLFPAGTLMNNTDLVRSLLHAMPHFPGYNPNRHRRAFLRPCHPTPAPLPADISVTPCPNKLPEFDLCTHSLLPTVAQPPGPAAISKAAVPALPGAPLARCSRVFGRGP